MTHSGWKVVADGVKIGQYHKRGKAVIKARLARRSGAKEIDIIQVSPGVSARADVEALNDGVRQQQQDA